MDKGFFLSLLDTLFKDADGKYQLKGNFVTDGTSYTKGESDGKYAQNFNGNEGL